MGRFLSVDPLTQNYPWYTPYQFAGNKPIWFIDIDGLEEGLPESLKVPVLTNASESTCIGCAQRKLQDLVHKTAADRVRLQKEYEAWSRNPENRGKPVPPRFEKLLPKRSEDRLEQGGVTGSYEYKRLKAQYDTYGQYLPGPSDIVDGLTAMHELSEGNYRSAAVAAFFLIPGTDVFKPIKSLKGVGGELLEKHIKKFGNQSKHLTKKDIEGALKDIAGTPVVINGKTYQHLKEVEEALSGVGDQLSKLTRDIDSGKFTGEVLEQAQKIRGTLQKQKDQITDVLNEAKRNVNK